MVLEGGLGGGVFTFLKFVRSEFQFRLEREL